MRGLSEAYHGPWDEIRETADRPERVNYTCFESHVVPAPWNRGRVVIIGDAAHSCPPTVAQGAAQALEDAAVLAELLLTHDDLDDVWPAFTDRRYDRAQDRRRELAPARPVAARRRPGRRARADGPRLPPRRRARLTHQPTPKDTTDDRDRQRARSERLITHLRHVDLAVPDYDKQLEFYTDMWGLKPETTDDGLAFLAAEGSPEQYAVRLRKDDEKRLDLISFGAANTADVDAMAERLGTAGVQLVTEPDKLQTPGGGYGFRFFDNDGRTVEVSSDVAVRQHRKVEEGESIPVKLSHVVINSPNPEATSPSTNATSPSRSPTP